MKNIILIAISLVFVSYVNAQERVPTSKEIKKAERKERINQLIKEEEEGALIFQKQSVFGIKLTSDGYSAFYELGRLSTPIKTNLYSLEIGERKHPKEEKFSNSTFNGTFNIVNPFIFGKKNNFYYAKLGYGQQRLIGGKGNKNGVAASAIYGGGFSAGLLKPYYLNVDDPVNGNQTKIKYEDNELLFLEPRVISGASGIGKGFNEISFVPGAFAKAAMRFDYGRYNEVVSAVEVGVNVEFYSKKMPIMLLNKEKNLFFNAYAAIVFGKRK